LVEQEPARNGHKVRPLI
jgi:hypothetical protein